jgi:hypothetical protein
LDSGLERQSSGAGKDAGARRSRIQASGIGAAQYVKRISFGGDAETDP